MNNGCRAGLARCALLFDAWGTKTKYAAALTLVFLATATSHAREWAVVSISTGPAGPSEKIDVPALLDRNGCLGCHGTTYKIVGPAYRMVAQKYRADPDGLAKIQASIRGGSVGRWGPAAMPAFRSLSDAQVRALAVFVMQQ